MKRKSQFDVRERKEELNKSVKKLNDNLSVQRKSTESSTETNVNKNLHEFFFKNDATCSKNSNERYDHCVSDESCDNSVITIKSEASESSSFHENYPQEDNVGISNTLNDPLDTYESDKHDEVIINETSEANASKNVESSIEKNLLHELNVPVIDFGIPCKSDFETAVLQTLTQLKTDMNHIKLEQAKLNNKFDRIITSFEDMQNFLVDKKIVQGSIEVNYEKTYDIKMPLATMDDFEKFNAKLESNEYFKNDVYKELLTYIDKDLVISRSIVKMLKKFLTKELALKFTAVRCSADKSKVKFKSTTFCNLIDVVIRRSRNEKSMDTSPDELVSCLSDVLCNVKRWSA